MPSLPEFDNLSDEEIVNLTLKNQDNFTYLINRYQDKLFNYIRRITNIRDEDAQDLLQDIFLKIYLNLNDFDNSLKFSSWVYAISRNQVISNHRKLQVRVEGHSVPLEDDSAKKIISGFNIEKEIDSNYLKNNVFKVLDALDEKYRDILILKFIEEKNYQEISDIIKKPVGTVGSMMNKAKKMFKDELSRQDLKI
ncbi:MAG: sigma-70 family RNA polymerase sigma factor [Patescibacteria group bacterium]